MKNSSFENKCSLELETDTDYTCKGGNLSNLFYTGVPYDSVYSIHFNGITVGIIYISFGDVERVYPILIQKVKGIGKKYQALVQQRIFDYSSVTKVRTQKKTTIRFASSPEFSKAYKMIGVELV